MIVEKSNEIKEKIVTVTTYSHCAAVASWIPVSPHPRIEKKTL
jgi:hypothetical protein